MTTRLLMALAVVVGILAWAATATAQSCCAASQADGPVRLSMGQIGSVGIDASTKTYTGVFAGDDYRSLEHRGHEFRQSLFGAWRLGDDWLVGAVLPLVQNRRQATELVEWGGGLGDLSVQSRYEVVTTGASASWPGIGLVASVTAPTGRSPSQSMDRGLSHLQADVTGSGYWRGGVAGQVEWTWRNTFLAGQLGISQGLPYTDGRGDSVLPGLGASARLSVGRTFSSALFWDHTLYTALSLAADHSGARRIDGQSVPATSERLTTLSAQAGGYMTETIYLALRASWDVPVTMAGQNRMAGPGAGLILRKVFYDF